MAFGTARHPSTLLCIKALRDTVNSGDEVLDFGSGSGILSILALKLGASKVNGVEIDTTAIENAERNLLLNNISNSIVFCNELDFGNTRKYNVVTANIDFNTIDDYLDKLKSAIVSGGKIILSGFEENEFDKVVNLLSENCLEKYSVEKSDGWIAVIATV